MPIDPIIASILEASPPMPAIWETPLDEYRGRINQMSKAAPRYDVPLASVTDRTIDAGEQTLGVRIYTPEGEGPFPLFVYYHGGGFAIGDLEISDPICRAIASGACCIVLSVDYRLAPEHPHPIPDEDCWNAFLWAIEHGAELGARSGPVAAGGDSAGANLTAGVAIRARDAGKPLAAQVLLYPSPAFETDFPSFSEHAQSPVLTQKDIFFFWDHYLPAGVDRSSPAVAPLHAKSHLGLAPAFVATAELDPTRDAGEAYGYKLTEAGCETFVKRYPSMPHGFYSMVAYVPQVKQAMRELTDWLRLRW